MKVWSREHKCTSQYAGHHDNRLNIVSFTLELCDSTADYSDGLLIVVARHSTFDTSACSTSGETSNIMPSFGRLPEKDPEGIVGDFWAKKNRHRKENVWQVSTQIHLHICISIGYNY